jgi:branched-subunit amino acid aminotransferase/4-amino-4-deoxychorismate lyase
MSLMSSSRIVGTSARTAPRENSWDARLRFVTELNGVPASPEHLRALALVNYGHYTTMRVDDLRVRGLSLHLKRLIQDCREVFDADLDPDRIRGLVRHALAETPRSVVVRVTVFDPGLELGHPGADAQPHLLVTTRPVAPATLPPLRLQSVRYCREMPAVKHVGLFGALARRRIAQRNGFDDVLFIDAHTTISETATANVGFLRGEKIIWPQTDCLAGVTMRLIKAAAGTHATTAPVTLSQLADVDAAFATNAAVGVRPIMAIDGVRWSTGHPRLKALCQQYTGIRPEPL